MKKYALLASMSAVLLAGCLDRFSEENTEKVAESKSFNVEESASEESNRKESESLEQKEVITNQEAANNIEQTKETPKEYTPPTSKNNVKDATNIQEVSEFVAEQFVKWLNGDITSEEFVKQSEMYWEESFLEQLGSTSDTRIATLTSVYDSYYKPIYEGKIKSYTLTTPSEYLLGDKTLIVYRKQILVDGTEQYFEMQFVPNSKGKWLLVDDMPTNNKPMEKEDEEE